MIHNAESGEILQPARPRAHVMKSDSNKKNRGRCPRYIIALQHENIMTYHDIMDGVFFGVRPYRIPSGKLT